MYIWMSCTLNRLSYSQSVFLTQSQSGWIELNGWKEHYVVNRTFSVLFFEVAKRPTTTGQFWIYQINVYSLLWDDSIATTKQVNNRIFGIFNQISYMLYAIWYSHSIIIVSCRISSVFLYYIAQLKIRSIYWRNYII